MCEACEGKLATGAVKPNCSGRGAGGAGRHVAVEVTHSQMVTDKIESLVGQSESLLELAKDRLGDFVSIFPSGPDIEPELKSLPMAWEKMSVRLESIQNMLATVGDMLSRFNRG
jgi:hypothetical protein